jgi:hypothetical protein
MFRFEHRGLASHAGFAISIRDVLSVCILLRISPQAQPRSWLLCHLPVAQRRRHHAVEMILVKKWNAPNTPDGEDGFLGKLPAIL